MTVKNLINTNTNTESNKKINWFIDGRWYPIIPDDIGKKTVKSWWADMRDTVYIRTKVMKKKRDNICISELKI